MIFLAFFKHITFLNFILLINFVYLKLVCLFYFKKLSANLQINENLIYKKGLFYFCLPKKLKTNSFAYSQFLSNRSLYVEKICRPAFEKKDSEFNYCFLHVKFKFRGVWGLITYAYVKFFFICRLKFRLFVLKIKLRFVEKRRIYLIENNKQIILKEGKFFDRIEPFVINDRKTYRIFLIKRNVFLKWSEKKLVSLENEYDVTRLLLNKIKAEFFLVF